MKKKYVYIIFVSALVVTQGAFAAPTQESFGSPSDAAQALREAAASENIPALTSIMGATFINEIRSGDAVADKNHLRALAERMREGQTLVARQNGLQILEVGKEHWPFPAPLIEKDGRWQFNSYIGAQEAINRRIGENELRAINVAQFYVDAQRLYYSKDRDGDGELEYASKFMSTPGKLDGLYWERTADAGVSPFGPLVGRAIAEGYTQRKKSGDSLYQGYHYRILSKQGSDAPGGKKNYLSRAGQMTEGFALLAYPSRYGVSGVMSFIVGSDGIVYEKDLGDKTEQQARAITSFDPDDSWGRVKELSPDGETRERA